MTLVAAFIFVAFLLESSKLSGLVDHPLSPLCFAISALRIPDLVVAVLAHKAVVPKLAFILLALSWTPLIGAGADVYMYMYMYYNTNTYIYIYIYTHTHIILVVSKAARSPARGSSGPPSSFGGPQHRGGRPRRVRISRAASRKIESEKAS